MPSKMDMIWIATAKLIHPSVSATTLVDGGLIQQEIARIFHETITPVMLNKHLVSWENKQTNPKTGSGGGSRNRYLFRTTDGLTPDARGRFRFYKHTDSTYDGTDKTGPTCPERQAVQEQYWYLLDWYESKYY